MSRTIVTGIDIGSSSVRVAVCEYSRKSDILIVRALIEKRSRGLRHGYIINSDEASKTLREALREAEKSTGVKIKKAIIGIGGVSITTITAIGSIAIARADTEVTEYDVKRAISASEDVVSDKANLRIIHTIPLEFKVDGKKVMGRPESIRGSKLEVKTLFVMAHSAHLAELTKVIEKSGIVIEDIFASTLAEAVVTLSPIQKSAGCVLANIGSETVSIAVFEEGRAISLQVFPIGSTDITNDIALGLKITLDEAEKLKMGGDGSLETKQVQKKMDEIIGARLSDIFELIEEHLKKIGRSRLLPAGIVITGGGARQEAILEMAKEYLSLPAQIGKNVVVPDGYKFPEIKSLNQNQIASKEMLSLRNRQELVSQPEWSVAFGLCTLGLDLDTEESLGIQIANRAKSSILGWLKQFLP